MTKLYRPFPDMAKAGAGHTTIAEEYLTEADAILAYHLPLRLTTEDINLTSGTREYAFSDSLISRVWTVRYLRSATADDSYKLEHTDLTKLDLESGNWEALDDGEPQSFYLGSSSAGALRIGVSPSPDTTTSGGYPILRCRVSKTAALASGGSLPDNIRTATVYVACAAWRYAEDYRDPEVAEQWLAKFNRALAAERDFFFGRSVYDKEEIQWASFPGGGAI